MDAGTVVLVMFLCVLAFFGFILLIASRIVRRVFGAFTRTGRRTRTVMYNPRRR